MTKFYLFLLFAFSSFSISAKLFVSKEYSFSPALLENIKSSLIKAQNRASELQQYPVIYGIDSERKISLWCPPHQPDTSLEGCSINFRIEDFNKLSFTIQKNVILKNTINEIKVKTTTVDPNSTQEHLHFGNLFGSKDESGSHYFCQPEGEYSRKTWGCYLFVSESVNK